MPIPSEFTPILQSLPLVSSEWDEENRTLVLTTGRQMAVWCAR